jgi:hypothetical protein
VAEVALGSVTYAVSIALSAPRFAPLLVTSFVLATSVVSFTRPFPQGQLNVLASVLLLVELAPAALIVVFRKRLFARLLPQTEGSDPPSP